MLIISCLSFGQNETKNKKKVKNQWQERYSGGKGTFFLRYGWNRSIYSKSNISFWGPGYDFTVKDAVGNDNPTEFKFDVYFSLKYWSVPQFSTKIGYYFADHWAVSVGWDHMKYVLQPGVYKFSGHIDSSAYPDWAGVYNDTPIQTTHETFHYENSDGLNYCRVEIHRADQWWRQRKGIVAVNTLFGLSTGMIITRNDFGIGQPAKQNDFEVSGWGLSAHIGIRLDLFNFFFLQTNFGGGMIHIPKVNTKVNAEEYAKQIFGFGEMDIAFGALWYIKKINRVPEKHIRPH